MNPTDKETLRQAALEALVFRHPAALSAPQVSRAVRKEVAFPFEESDMASALEVLKGLEMASAVNEELGASKYWSATAKGVLHVERMGA